jgi:hypothetical protein
MLDHTWYYMKFIRGYAQIKSPLEKVLNKEAKFQWNEECHKSSDTLNKKLIIVLILVFPDWKKEFHVYVDAFSIELGAIIAQLGEGGLYHPIAFAIKRFSTK